MKRLISLFFVGWTLTAALANAETPVGAETPDLASVSAEEIWLGDLVGALPPTPQQEQALLGYLEVALLGPAEMSPVSLPSSLTDDEIPRFIFVSLSDGASPARVVQGSGRGFAAALQNLMEQAQHLHRDGLKARAYKLDLVRDVAVEKGVDLSQPLRLDRGLYGLALEPEISQGRVRLALLPEELVAYTLVNSKNQPRLGNLKKRPKNPALELTAETVKELRKLSEADLYRFSCRSFYSDGRELAPLFRGHRTFPQTPTPEGILEAAQLGGAYLKQATSENGRFIYAYLPKTREVKSKYNILRHAGTIYSMLELYEVTREESLLEAAERALGYLRAAVQTCRVQDAKTGEPVETECVEEDGEVKLGGNALAMIALSQHAKVTGSEEHFDLIDGLGRWILAVQAENGEFTIHKQSFPGGVKSSFVSGYYPGEALLALSRRPVADPVWLDAAAQGARWLIQVRDAKVPTPNLNHDHWLLYALNEIHRKRPDPVFLDHAKRIMESMVSLQNRRPATPDWLGSYYRPPRSTPTATRSEGLGAAYHLFRDFDLDWEADRALEAMELGVRFQLQTQFRGPSLLYLGEPHRAMGGFRRSLDNFEIRIDYVQHNISALLLLRKILLSNPANSSDLAASTSR